jgi:O-antigen/teichoic acid export membrane protein
LENDDKIRLTPLVQLLMESVYHVKQSSLYGNALFLMLNSVVTSLLGFVFWHIMAANFTPNEVGIGSTLISLSTLLGTLSSIGLGLGLIRFVPLERNPCELVNTAFTITGIMAIICSLIYLAGLNIFAPLLKFMLKDYRLSIIFVGIIVCTSLSLIIDQSFVAARCTRFVFMKNLIVCLLKLPLPVLFFAELGGYGIFTATGMAVLMGLVVSFVFFMPLSFTSFSPRPVLKMGVVKDMLLYSFWNYIADFLIKSPGLIYPLMVPNLYGAEQGAYFYIAWMMTMVLAIIPTGLSQSLLSEGYHEPKKIAQLARKSLFMALGLSFAGVGFITMTSELLLGFFGQDYSQGGAAITRLLVIAVIPQSVNSLYMAVNQVKKRMNLVLIQAGALSIIALGMGFWMLKKTGPQGAAAAYVISHVMVALFAIRPMWKLITKKTFEQI